jgi:hypothetical protein
VEELHDFVTMRGSEAGALVAIFGFLTLLWRWFKRMRASTREAFARTIGEQVAGAIAPVVERMDGRITELDHKVQAMRRDFDHRRTVDDQRWATTESYHHRLDEHMAAEEARHKETE